MSFLKIKPKKVLVFEEMFPREFYHPNEIKAIRESKDFFAFTDGGYYKITYVNPINNKLKNTKSKF